jgi:hypothetical protein
VTVPPLTSTRLRIVIIEFWMGQSMENKKERERKVGG